MFTDKSYNRIIVLGDVNISTKRPAKRIGDNYYQAVMGKLDHVLEQVGDDDLLLVNGCLSLKKFDVRVFSDLMTKFAGKNVLVMPTSETINSSGSLSKHSLVSLLDQAGTVRAVQVGENIDIQLGESRKVSVISDYKQYSPAPDNIAISSGPANRSEDFQAVISTCGADSCVHPGVVGRISYSLESSSPSFMVIDADASIHSLEIPHERFVFEERGIAPSEENPSNFVTALDHVSRTEMTTASVDEVTDDILRSKGMPGPVWEIIDALKITSSQG